VCPIGGARKWLRLFQSFCMTDFLTFLISLVIVVHQVLYWTYLWQLKEYRRDRFLAGIAERSDLSRALREQFNLLKWYRPRWTARAILSLLLGLGVAGFLVGENNFMFRVLVVLLVPVVSAVSVAVVTPPFWFWKEVLVYRAGVKMKKFKGGVIGIAGSYGKSSTKEILKQVLSSKFKVQSTEGNDNSEIGVAQTVLRKLRGDEDFFVVEMGAYRRGEIKKICEMVRPKFGIVTGIGDQHLELFGSQENLRRAKMELVEALPSRKNGLVAEEDFSLGETKSVRVLRDYVEFGYAGEKFAVPLVGKQPVRNVVAVIKMARLLGMSLPEISAALGKFSPDLIYPKIKKIGENEYIIDNSYNNSFESFFSALDYLQIWEGFRKIVVTPGIMELGERGKADHEKIGRELKAVDTVLVTHDNFFSELNASMDAQLVTDFRELVEKVRSYRGKNVVILFQGKMPKAVLTAVEGNR